LNACTLYRWLYRDLHLLHPAGEVRNYAAGLSLSGRKVCVLAIDYQQTNDLDADTFIRVLESSGLAKRRPAHDRDRIARMLAGSNLIIVACDGGTVVGVARALTDYAYCCYLSDLAVDRAYQGRGIGRQLIEETRRAAGPETMCLLLSAPDAVGFYESIQMPLQSRAFMFPRER
jgi:GNAT superfamily N-acetyltransferase